MATYLFGILSSAEAASYNALTDDIQFTNVPGATAQAFSVSGTTITRIETGGSIALGNQANGDTFILPDGSKLTIPAHGAVTVTGTTFADNLYGGIGRDTVRGLGGNDRIYGGEQFDTLTGGGGQDTISGGGGIDTYIFAPGDSGVAAGQIDVINDWDSGEHLVFSTPMSGGDYMELTAASYADALQAANAQIANGAADVVAVQVGSDVFVFADTRGDNGGADDAIWLTGRGLLSIARTDVGGISPGPQVPEPPTLPGQVQTGTNGPDTLTGWANNDTIMGLDGSDVLRGEDGDDSISGDRGHDTLFGGRGADTLDGDFEGDSISGDEGADVIITDGQDSISGGGGADIIHVQQFQNFLGEESYVLDWSVEDRLVMGQVGGDYAEATAADFESGRLAAVDLIRRGGKQFVSVQVGDDVIVFGGSPDHFNQSTAIRLVGRTLDDVSAANVGMPGPPPAPAVIPAAPTRFSTATIAVTGDMDRADLSALDFADVVEATSTRLVAKAQFTTMTMVGSGFVFDSNHNLLSGAAQSITFEHSAPANYFRLQISVTGARSASDPADESTQAFLAALLTGADRLTGSPMSGVNRGADLLRGYASDDHISGMGGDDTIFGGLGDDVIYAFSETPAGDPAGSTYLRGDEGGDWIRGGAGFDDIHGNMGNDTAAGGVGNDWVVGGKDNDLLFGEAGNDLVYGNIGNDTCDGGDGDDVIRGGQDNDIVRGWNGADYVSGDKGSDTVTGGAGADIFHTFGDAGVDRVTDFNLAEGDRVQLDPGTQYTVSQVGADTVISMTGGGQMILVGVQMSSLTAGWIFGA